MKIDDAPTSIACTEHWRTREVGNVADHRCERGHVVHVPDGAGQSYIVADRDARIDRRHRRD